MFLFWVNTLGVATTSAWAVEKLKHHPAANIPLFIIAVELLIFASIQENLLHSRQSDRSLKHHGMENHPH
jgi:hypothetical protein